YAASNFGGALSRALAVLENGAELLGGVLDIGFGPPHVRVIINVALVNGRQLVSDQVVVVRAQVFERSRIAGRHYRLSPADRLEERIAPAFAPVEIYITVPTSLERLALSIDPRFATQMNARSGTCVSPQFIDDFPGPFG